MANKKTSLRIPHFIAREGKKKSNYWKEWIAEEKEVISYYLLFYFILFSFFNCFGNLLLK